MRRHLRSTFAAVFASHNYRLYLAGQSVSLTGTWMQTIAQGWLVLQLTGSGTAIGLVTALQFLPVLILGPLGGVLVDRVNTRRLLLVTQLAAASLAALLGVVVLAGVVQLWMVYAIAFTFGLVTVADNPARQTFVLQLVGPDHLANAVMLNTVNINAARIVGPAVAAIVIATLGIGPCFVLNAVSYLVIVGALLLMHTRDMMPRRPVPRQKGQVREALRYVGRTPALRAPLVMMAVVGMLAYEFQVSLPILAKFTFGGTAATYGSMMGAMGVGAVVGGLATAHRQRFGLEPLVRVVAVFGATILAVSVSPTLPVALGALVATGAVSVVFLAMANTTLQLGADPDMRGRVMSLWTVAFIGSTPIGGTIVGWLGEHAGPRWALGIGALACLGAAVYGRQSLRARTATARRAEPVTVLS